MITFVIGCDTCSKKNTTKCPNSSECYSLEDKPKYLPLPKAIKQNRFNNFFKNIFK